MKLPDLTDIDAAGVHEQHAPSASVASAAAAAGLRFFDVDLGHVDSKYALLELLSKGLALPAHFGHNWDALADSLEDDDVIGRHGAVLHLAHAVAYRKAHSRDWQTFEEILDEAADFWRERHIPLWVFVA